MHTLLSANPYTHTPLVQTHTLQFFAAVRLHVHYKKEGAILPNFEDNSLHFLLFLNNTLWISADHTPAFDVLVQLIL
jgi:hypothetical protein